MLKSLKCLKLSAFALLLTAPCANADQLFTNWSTAVVAGPGYTAGGGCNASCFAISDNFSNSASWVVTDIAVYVDSYSFATGNPSGWRYALFTASGTQIIAPTDAGNSLVFTDTGTAGAFGDGDGIYKGVISGLNITLPPDEYWFRFTNTNSSAVYPAYAASPSAQTLTPGFVQLTGSPTVEALLSTDVTQRTENWAFEVYGIGDRIFANDFEGP